jgi:hypothetical protein
MTLWSGSVTRSLRRHIVRNSAAYCVAYTDYLCCRYLDAAFWGEIRGQIWPEGQQRIDLMFQNLRTGNRTIR